MALKIDNRGFTLVELLLMSFIIVISLTYVVLFLNPPKKHMQARDEVRLSDMFSLARGIEEYYLDKGLLPDTDATLRLSNVLPSGNAGPLQDTTGNGWIDSDFTGYFTKLFTDPTNTGSLIYKYQRSGSTYELNAVLEGNLEPMQKDGGNNAGVYEVGSSLTILN